MVDKDNQWTLEGPTITSRIGSLNASTATSMDIWQRNTKRKRKNKKQESVSNVTKNDILPKIVKRST